MLKPLFAAALLAIPAAVALRPAPAAPAPQACTDFVRQQPVLIYDVTGSTLLGPVHRNLVVYGNGLASISDVSGAPPVAKAEVTNVSPDLVGTLLKDLRLAGAFTLCDQQQTILDVPLRSVTVSRGSTDSMAHTYNYWVAGASAYAVPEQVLEDFIDLAFPSF